jgi:hypothetical protein
MVRFHNTANIKGLHLMMFSIQNQITASAWSLTDGVKYPMNNTAFAHPLTDLIFAGLAPEIPEDLYMLIKKVSTFRYADARNLLISYSPGRRCSQAS